MAPNNNRRNAHLAVGGILVLALLIFSLTQLLRPPTPNAPERTIQTSQTPTLIAAIAPSPNEVPPVAAVQIVPTATIPPADTPTALPLQDKPIPHAGNPAPGALYGVWAIVLNGVLLLSRGVALKKISS